MINTYAQLNELIMKHSTYSSLSNTEEFIIYLSRFQELFGAGETIKLVAMINKIYLSNIKN